MALRLPSLKISWFYASVFRHVLRFFFLSCHTVHGLIKTRATSQLYMELYFLMVCTKTCTYMHIKCAVKSSKISVYQKISLASQSHNAADILKNWFNQKLLVVYQKSKALATWNGRSLRWLYNVGGRNFFILKEVELSHVALLWNVGLSSLFYLSYHRVTYILSTIR